MKDLTIKRLAYVAGPLLSIAVVAGVASAAVPSQEEGGASRTRPELTEEQRSILDQARELRQSGDLEGAKTLLETSGIKPPPRGMRKGHDPLMKARGEERHEAVEAALDAGDYQAFVEATKDAPFADQVNEAFFEKFQEAHVHFEAGQAILAELGVQGPRGPHQNQ